MNLEIKELMKIKKNWCPTLIIFIFIFLLIFRSVGLYPFIMADEYHYSFLSRLIPIEHTYDPIYLYLKVYRLTNLCNDGFLQCARYINIIFYALGCFLVYKSARLYVDSNVSILVLILTLLAPESIYVNFFMPEAMYFASVWLFIYCILRGLKNQNLDIKNIASSGIFLAISSLIKPHAIFLLVGFLLFLVIYWSMNKKNNIRSNLISVSIMLATFCLVKFGFGFAVAGKAGLTFFGSRYGSMASENITVDRISYLLKISSLILLNHLSLLVVIFFLPLYWALKTLKPSNVEHLKSNERNFVIFSLVLFITLVVVSSAFTASVAGSNPYDVIDRVHTRYYNFLFPLLLILSGIMVSADKVNYLNLKLPIVVIGSLLMAGMLHLSGYINIVKIFLADAPGLVFITTNQGIRFALIAIGFLVFFYSLHNFRNAARLFVVIYLPFVFIAGLVAMQKEVDIRKTLNDYDIAGIITNSLLIGAKEERVAIFGQEIASLYLTSFYIDRSSTNIKLIATNQIVSDNIIPNGTTTLIVFGNNEVKTQKFKLVLEKGFKIYSSSDNKIGVK